MKKLHKNIDMFFFVLLPKKSVNMIKLQVYINIEA